MSNHANTPLLAAYLVVGEDQLKRDAVMRRLRARVAALGDLTFNSDSFSGESAAGSDIVNACMTMPFASQMRWVEVQGADKLKKADSEALVSYLEHPSDTTVLALVADALAKNTRLYKAVAAFGATAVIDCAPQQKRDLMRTVRALGSQQGISLTERAAWALIDAVGENTVRLDAEIKKIALARLGVREVTDRDIEQLVAHTNEAKPWQFVDAFAARDASAGLALLARMPAETPTGLLGRCVTRIRELICTQSLIARGQQNRIAQELGYRDWRVRNHPAWARTWKPAELRAALASARDAEQAMKSGADKEQTLITWFVSTTSRRG